MAYGPYKDLIIAAAQKRGINPVYLAGLIDQESGWDPQAIGDNGKSFGFGQFNVNGALKTYGLTGEQVLAMDPAQQIDLVADFYKKNLIVAKGDPDKALRLYNGGGDPNYVNKVYRRINESGLNAPQTERFAPVTSTKMPTGVNPEFQQSFNAFQTAAKEAGHVITPGSTFRTKAKQTQLWADAITKYGTPAKARKWVAPPGSSSHEHGLAMDLKYSSPEAQKWAHENASKFNLNFRLSNEPWHLEPTNARDQIAGVKTGQTQNTFGNYTIDVTQPAGFVATPMPPFPGFSKEMQQLLTGAPMDEENQIDPNTLALGQLLGAQQEVGQLQPNDFMSKVMGDPLLHMGLGIMAGQGSFAQQIGAGALAGMKSYQDYQAAAQESKLSNIRLGIQAMNAQTAAATAADRMRENAIERQAMADLPPELQSYAQMNKAGLDPDVIKTEYLKKMGFPPELAAQLAVAGRNPGQGVQYKNVGGAVVEQRIDEKGNIVQTMAPEGPQQAAERSAGGMQFSQEYQKGLAKEVLPIQASMLRMPEFERKVDKIDSLIARLQAPDVPLTGPVIGTAGAAYDTFLGELRNFNIQETLEQIANSRLAPVSNVDFSVVSEGIASPSRTKDQNITFLKEVRKAYIQRMEGLKRIQDLRNNGKSWDEIIADHANKANVPNINERTAPAPTAYPGRGQVYPAVPGWEAYPPSGEAAAPTPAAPASGGAAVPASTDGIPPPGTREVQPDGSVIIW